MRDMHCVFFATEIFQRMEGGGSAYNACYGLIWSHVDFGGAEMTDNSYDAYKNLKKKLNNFKFKTIKTKI